MWANIEKLALLGRSMKESLEPLGIDIAVIIAGLVGSVTALLLIPALTFKQALAILVGGVGCAAYITPITVEIAERYIEQVDRNLENGLAFGLGIIGMNVIAGFLKLAQQWRQKPTLDIRDIGKQDDD